jgi:poly(A) polymerase
MLRRIRNLLTRIPKASRTPVVPAAEVPEPPSPTAAAAAAPAALARPSVSVRRGPKVVHHPIDPGELDPDAVRILQRLTRFDHTAYLVGGCVRDLLLGRRPKDFDIGTSATPRQIKRLFSNSRIIGRRFRLAHVYFQSGKIIEVATFRSYDVEEGEGEPQPAAKDLLIRDDNVFGAAEEDALRRDFTINALFYDAEKGTVLDHADGLADLRRRLIRTIGDPEIRFREDPIRILRAVKFAARLDFEIEGRTLEALKRTSVEIPRAAMPRVLEEINRFCRGGAARASFDLALETGVFDVILPELAGGYRRDGGARELMLGLMDSVDRRLEKGRETSTGEILAILSLPLLAAPLGWGAGGSAAPPRSIDLRDVTDALLRPLALRLRVSRKDQERCRQIVQTLGRMVPVRGLRKGVRQAILHRPAFADAIWILEGAGSRLGGDLAEAAAYWRSGHETGGAEPSAHEHPEHEAEAGELHEEGDAATRKRRRRRRSRRRGKGAPAAAGPAHETARPATHERVARERGPGERPQKQEQQNLPSPWDDNYFFAALPTAPKLEAEDGDTDRYGAATVARGLEAPEPEEAADRPGPAPSPDAPARRRRRRRRSRRGRPADGGPAPPPGPE